MENLAVKAAKSLRAFFSYAGCFLLSVWLRALNLFERGKIPESRFPADSQTHAEICILGNKAVTDVGDICISWEISRENRGPCCCDAAEHPLQLVGVGKMKLGIVCCRQKAKLSVSHLLRQCLRLRGAGADSVYVFFEAEGCESRELTRIAEDLSVIGCDCIFGVSPEMRAVRGRRGFNFRAVRIFPAFRTDAAVVHRYVRQKGKWRMQKEGYISPEGSSATTGDLRPWRDLLTVGDILDVLQTEPAPEWRAFREYSVSRLCARVAEAAPGNLFFQCRSARGFLAGILQKRLSVKAWLKGCAFIVAEKSPLPFIPCIRTEDPGEAHIAVTAWYRRRLNAQIIAVTGSTGKTSVKDVISRVLEQKFSVQESERNANVQVKIGANLQEIRADTEVFVQEIGGGSPGGASRHSRMVRPDMAVITNIGTAHIGNFSSQDELFQSKLGILDGLKDDGVLLINGDDPYLRRANFLQRTITFGIEDKRADFFGDNIRSEDGRTAFDIVFGGKRVRAEINAWGKHNVLNALCGFAVGNYLGVPEASILEGLKAYQTSGSRQNFFSVGGYRIYADCYNASLESMKTALSVFYQELPEAKKLAVLGQITGLGTKAAAIGEELAETLARYGGERILYYGESNESIDALQNVFSVSRRAELERRITAEIEPEDVLLFKGSSKMALDEIIDRIFGTNLADQRHLDESRYVLWRKAGIDYLLFSTYSTLAACCSRKDVVKLSGRFFGRPLAKLACRSFFRQRGLEIVVLNDGLLHIGEEAFFGCARLKRVEKGKGLKYIGDRAFMNCESLRSFDFADSLIHIGGSAFENCGQLEEIALPKSLYRIAPRTFAGCSSLKTAVIPGSVRRIEREAFAGCANLTRVYLDPARTDIAADAFRGCGSACHMYEKEIGEETDNG